METVSAALVITIVLAVFAILVVVKTAVVVPQQNAYVVERLGKFHAVLDAGFHVLFPFIDVIRYRHTLKEQAVDIPEQICITKDNVQVAVDGILYLKVLDAQRASYGIADYYYAISQLAQTALRSEIGKIDLDRTFEERTHINGMVITELDKATGPWGIKVLRYEIKNITPPQDVLAAMEKQMRAEREKRAVVLTSEGERDAAINTAEGKKQQVIKESEAHRQRQINEAEGQANAIQAIAQATADGLRKVAEAISQAGGAEAVQLRVAEQYVAEFGKLARTTNTVILPATLSDVGSMIALATNVLRAGPAGEPIRNTVLPAPRAHAPPASPPPASAPPAPPRPPSRPLPGT
jgi:regulator of protease activity HflC (stomatin/prohibitin superfamily)